MVASAVKTDNVFDQFMEALLFLYDERARSEPRPEQINAWCSRAQYLFERAVADAVQRKVESLTVRVVVDDDAKRL